MKHQNINVIENGIKITLNLGRQGDYNVRDIKFDMSDFQQKYGDGTATIVHYPANGSAYTVPSISGDSKDSAVLDSDNILTWTIGKLATRYDGKGIAEITWITVDGLKKSIRYNTYCKESIGNYGADRTAQQSYIDQMVELASTIADLSVGFSDAERIAAEISYARENAASDIEASKNDAVNAVNTAKQTALTDIESAKQNAETDINAEILIAETHANNASQSATNASNSATNASNSADSADQSAALAQTSATNASNSAANASQYADNASSSANSASQSATSAQTSATNASASEQSARQSAETAQDILDSVQAEGDTQINRVQSEGNTQIGRVQAKGNEILNSLPSDFTQVQNDIAALNGSLDTVSDALSVIYELTPQTSLTYVGAGYITDSGTLANASGYSTYAYTATKAGKMYVTGTASNHQCAVAKCSDAVYSEGTWTSATVIQRLTKNAGTLPTVDNPLSYNAGETIAISMTGLSTSIYVGGIYVDADRVENLENSIYAIKPSQCAFFKHKNLIDPKNISTLVRYSPASTSFIADTSGNYASTGMIPVTEGVTYCYSGTAATYSGGYFGSNAECAVGQLAIEDIAWTVSVDSSGRFFTVPEGIGIKYVCINMAASNGIVSGTYQLEIGEVGTEIVAYDEGMKIDTKYLPTSGGGSGSVAGLDALEPVSYGAYERSKIANFIRHWKRRDKDLVVVGTGTSLSARGVGYCETLADANARPPLMDSKNLASRIWDKIAWDHQYYRRYDYSGFFTETGTWKTAVDLAVNGVKQWDDGAYRNGLTRYAEGTASVAYTLPANAWAANFIFRTDESGSESCTIAVTEGDGKVEVWNGSAWVEANGYVFSQKQTVQTLSNVAVPDPTKDDNATTTYTTYQIGGNTVYQKRLKMRCIDRTATKTITISSASGRMMYWGVEWSEREHMIIYINSARGSYNITHNSANALHKTQETDIWVHKPDLIFTENPIHNSGASGYTHQFVNYPSSYWYNITHNFFFNEDSPVSLASRATANGITGLEWIVYDSTITPNFQGINEDGTLIIAPDKDGKMITALDAMQMSQDYFADHSNVVSINAVKYWIDAAVALFGDLYTATQAGGVDGATFTFEGSHWNTTGAAVMFKAIGGIFDFY